MTEYQKHAEDLISDFIKMGQEESMAIKSTIILLQYAFNKMGNRADQNTQKALNYLTGVGKVIHPMYVKNETTAQEIYSKEWWYMVYRNC